MLVEETPVTPRATVRVKDASSRRAKQIPKPTALNERGQVQQPQNGEAKQGIQIIDRGNPSYRGTLQQLDATFQACFRSMGMEDMNNEDIKSAVVLLVNGRLSQMMYEATNARIVSSSPDKVIVVIPSYSTEGEDLKKYLYIHLPPTLTTTAVEDILRQQFASFGKFPQQVEFQKDILEGEEDRTSVV